MDNITYKPDSETTEVVIDSKPKSLALTVIFSLFLGTYCAMLYLARPVRFVAYLSIFLIIELTDILLFFGLQEDIELSKVLLYWIIIAIGTIDAYIICKKIPPGTIMPLYSRWYVILPSLIMIALIIFASRIFVVEPFKISSVSMLPNYKPGQYVFIRKDKASRKSLYGQPIEDASPSSNTNLISRGDVILFIPNDGDEPYIKRVIGIGGDRIKFSNNRFEISHCIDNVCSQIKIQRELIDDSYELPSNNYNSDQQTASRIRETIEMVSYDTLYFNHSFRPSCGVEECKTFTVPKGFVFVLGDNRDNSKDSRYTGSIPIENILGTAL